MLFLHMLQQNREFEYEFMFSTMVGVRWSQAQPIGPEQQHRK